MQYHYHRPVPQLSEYVQTVLIMEGFAKDAENKKPLFTNGMSALLCRTQTTPSGIEEVVQLSLFGKSTAAEEWRLNKKETLIAYFFKPFSLASLFNVPASTLARSAVDLSSWNAHVSNSLRTQLSFAKTSAAKKAVLDNLLTVQYNKQQHDCEMIRYATDQMMINPAKEVLAELLKKLHLTERTFQRIFKKFVGLSPSQYRRICQFKLSFEKLRKAKAQTLTDIAYDAGFADQSHFIRSFKEFTSTTPNDYKKAGLKKK